MNENGKEDAGFFEEYGTPIEEGETLPNGLTFEAFEEAINYSQRVLRELHIPQQKDKVEEAGNDEEAHYIAPQKINLITAKAPLIAFNSFNPEKRNNNLYEGVTNIVVIPEGKHNQEIKIAMRLEYRGAEENGALTEEDLEVYNSICSSISNGGYTTSTTGYPFITFRQISRGMQGKPTTSKDAIQRIINSIKKMQLTFSDFDASAQYEYIATTSSTKARNIAEREEKYGMTGKERHRTFKSEAIITGRFTTEEVYGQPAEGLEIAFLPSLWLYSICIGATTSTDIKALEVPTVKSTTHNSTLKFFLLRWIEQLKNKQSRLGKGKKLTPQQRTLTFSYIFDCCEIKEDKKAHMKARDTVLDLLDWWEAGKGETLRGHGSAKPRKKETGQFIKGYDVTKKGNVYYSITVEI